MRQLRRDPDHQAGDLRLTILTELESGEVISSITGPEYLSVFGESGLLATSRR
jgi:hypothetical protein